VCIFDEYGKDMREREMEITPSLPFLVGHCCLHFCNNTIFYCFYDMNIPNLLATTGLVPKIFEIRGFFLFFLVFFFKAKNFTRCLNSLH